MMQKNSLRTQRDVGVLTIDDHPIFRQGIHHMLEEEDGITPLAEVGSISDALYWLRHNRSDVALLDHNLAGANGVDSIPHLLNAQPDLQIIMLTVCDADSVFLQAIRFGACGYILKDTAPVRILEAIKAAASGECRVSDSLVRALFHDVGHPHTAQRIEIGAVAFNNDQHPETTEELPVSMREREILEHLVQGMSNKEIAKSLKISPNTVRNQLQKLQDSFSARNRVQLALFAYDRGVGNPVRH